MSLLGNACWTANQTNTDIEFFARSKRAEDSVSATQAYGTYDLFVRSMLGSSREAAAWQHAEARVHLKFEEQLGQAWVLDGVSGSDLKQEEVP